MNIPATAPGPVGPETGDAVWIVVLNWHGRSDTLELLDSLSGIEVKVVVVNNGSDDGTIQAVSARYPDMSTLQTGRNLGYSGGNNAGISYALSKGATVIGVLNNDTIVEPDFLTPLLQILASNPAAAVSPDIRYASSPDVSWFRGSKMNRKDGWPQHLQPVEQPAEGSQPVPGPVLTGCCIFATSATWRRVGTFDDRLFLMFEDSDWSQRAVAAGVKLLVVPRSRIYHKVSKSFTGSAGTLGTYYFARNGLIFAWRHLGPMATVRFLLHEILRPSLSRMMESGRRRSAFMLLIGTAAAIAGRRGEAGCIANRAARKGNP